MNKGEVLIRWDKRTKTETRRAFEESTTRTARETKYNPCTSCGKKILKGQEYRQRSSGPHMCHETCFQGKGPPKAKPTPEVRSIVKKPVQIAQPATANAGLSLAAPNPAVMKPTSTEDDKLLELWRQGYMAGFRDGIVQRSSNELRAEA